MPAILLIVVRILVLVEAHEPRVVVLAGHWPPPLAQQHRDVGVRVPGHHGAPVPHVAEQRASIEHPSRSFGVEEREEGVEHVVKDGVPRAARSPVVAAHNAEAASEGGGGLALGGAFGGRAAVDGRWVRGGSGGLLVALLVQEREAELGVEEEGGCGED